MSFEESNGKFYDLEYYISLEYRYLSGAHGSRIRNILRCVGDVKGRRILDIGGGHGFFASILSKRGGEVSVRDYSPFAVRFGKNRYPELDIKLGSAYDLSEFDEDYFDVVLLLDVIEHMSNHKLLMKNIGNVLKKRGRLIVSTDVDRGAWSGKFGSLMRRLHFLSKDGRNYDMIKNVERHRKSLHDYHESHISRMSCDELASLIREHGYTIKKNYIYPLVGVPIRDCFLRILPQKLRGDHQLVIAAREN